MHPLHALSPCTFWLVMFWLPCWCYEHDLSCSEHYLSCSHMTVMFSHVQSCSGKKSLAILKWHITGFEHPTIHIDADSANHFAQEQFWKFQTEKGTLSVNGLTLIFRLRTWTWSDATQHLVSTLYAHCIYEGFIVNKVYLPFKCAKHTLCNIWTWN